MNDINLNWPGERLVIKMWESLDASVASLLRPWHVRRLAIAETDAEVHRERQLHLLRIELQSISSDGNKSIETQVQRGDKFPRVPTERIEPSLSWSDLQECARQRAVRDFVRKELNVTAAILEAEEILLSDGSEPSKESVDPDWLHKWREGAGSVSKTQLQSLWAALLAGEVKSPGEYSLRTLSLLETLTPSEANLISRVAQFSIGFGIFRGLEDVMSEAAGVKFEDLMRLQEMGILDGVGGNLQVKLQRAPNTEKYEAFIKGHGRALRVVADESMTSIAVPAYSITAVGQEIMSLGGFEACEAYFLKMATMIRAQSKAVKGLRTFYGSIKEVGGKAIFQEIGEVTG